MNLAASFAAPTNRYLEAASELLPPSVAWGNVLVVVPVMYMVALVATLVPALIALRRVDANAPWWERARHAYAARVVGLLGLILMPCLASLAAATASGPLAATPAGTMQLLAATAAFCGAGVVCAHIEGIVLQRRTTFFDWLRDVVFSCLVGSSAVVFPAIGGIVVGCLLGDRPWLGFAITFALAVFAMFGGAFWIARVVGLVRKASPHMHDVVAAAAATAGAPVPRVYEFRTATANAYALGSRAVGVTTGAIRNLSDAHLMAVFAHELGHLAESSGVRRQRFAFRALLSLSFVMPVPLTELLGTFAFLVGPFVALIVYRFKLRFDRRLEREADAVACGHDAHAGALAHSLQAIHEVNVSPACIGIETTHPELYDRMLAAGETPSFPRPLPPPRRGAQLGGLGILIAVGLVALLRIVVNARSFDATNEEPVVTEIALTGGGAFDLARLAFLRAERGDIESALVLYRAAAELEPEDPHYFALAANALVPLGRCKEAEDMLARAEHARAGRAVRGAAGSELESARERTATCNARAATIVLFAP